MNFCFYSSLRQNSFYIDRKLPSKVAIDAKTTLLHDMNGNIVTHKISFVNYFIAEK